VLTLNFALPHEAILDGKAIKSVLVPSASGEMGLLADHVPVISELKAGVVAVEHLDDSVAKYFISGGFLVMDDKSRCNISALEAFPVEQLDGTLAKSELDRYTQLQVDASTPDAEAEAAIGVEVHQAIVTAAGEAQQ
jgi:F-type H+-transporting ATPase subunit delta